MLHNYLESYTELSGAHFAVGRNDDFILVQLQDDNGDQVRVRMSKNEAEHMVILLKDEIRKKSNELDN